jgi:predicted RecB family nuclease
MQLIDGRFVYSATDLNDDVECRHLTVLKDRVVRGELERPPRSEAAQLIAGKGNLHEERYLEIYRRCHGAGLIELPDRVNDTLEAMQAAAASTLAEMESGVRAIYQAFFFDGVFQGRADFLERVERPCAKWAWSYEVVDTKLALSAKPYFLLQICAYSDHLERLQGTLPENAHVILGSGDRRSFRVNDYIAYYRHRRHSFLESRERSSDAYSIECSHCNICEWVMHCDDVRDRDDHLGLVALLRNDQLERLRGAGITTIAELAAADLERDRPHKMSPETFKALRHQAQLQHRQRTDYAAGIRDGRQYHYDLIPYLEKTGFELLPPPDEGDIYFDMEGDPLFSPTRGLEYLFGAYVPKEDRYIAYWAKDSGEEEAAFEGFLAFVRERRERFPNLHVYHYAPYEVAALRRLQARFYRNEDEVDDLQRANVFVDLYRILRQTLRISQPGYGLKKVEPFYGKERLTGVKRGDASIVEFERWIATGDDAILEDIRKYNEDDCRSTYMLHGWLLARREERQRETGAAVPWFSGAPLAEETVSKQHPMAAELLAHLPTIETEDALRAANEAVRAKWLLAHLLDYYRREDKPVWWRIFDQRKHPELLEESDSEAIAGLVLRDDMPPFKLKARDRNFVYTYSFPEQQHNLGSRAPQCPHTGKDAGPVVLIDDARNLLQIKLAKAIDPPSSLRALVPGRPFSRKGQFEAVERFATAYAGGMLRAEQRATYDLLLARPPRLSDRAAGATIQPGEVNAANLSAIVRALDGGTLCIQGPPGSGKSTTGACVIVDLLAAGKRVAVTALSHAAIKNLLNKVDAEAAERGLTFSGAYKLKRNDAEPGDEARGLTQNAIAFAEDYTFEHVIAGGTSWSFSPAEMQERYDYLFIDEAGQVPLADAIACGPCARNIVLLGDPLQLAQVSQGTHPPGAGLSVLQHLLGGAQTIAADRGIFLDVSYRMHPEICSFISDSVYEGRLKPFGGTAGHRIVSAGLSGSGLRYLPIPHRGNQRRSEEEAQAIVAAALRLIEGRVAAAGKPERPMSAHDILVVAPYNAQRKLVGARLSEVGLGEIRVGTVDKFQGQEAPVVFYSMATSSGDDIPRDMAFLFEKNRFNVAISRAQCMSVLVCSPELLDAKCSAVDDMALANLLCAYVDAATGG